MKDIKFDSKIKRKDELKFLRKKILILDETFLKILAQRFELVEKIAVLKKSKSLEIKDKNHEKKHLKKCLEKISQEQRLNKEFVKKILKLIFKYSVKFQNQILKK